MSSCPKCGSTVRDGAEYCTVCGNHLQISQNNSFNFNQQYTQIDNQYNSQQYNNSNTNWQYTQNNQFYQDNFINDDDLIDAYIGKNDDSLKKGNYSFCAALFGMWYTLYRKMWLFTVIFVLATLGAGVIATILGMSSALSGAANIIMGIIFKKYYLKHVKEQVEKIKNQNIGKTNQELIAICRQKGGTTIIPIIIGVLLSVVFLIVATITLVGVLNNYKQRSQDLIDYNFPKSWNYTLDFLGLPGFLLGASVGDIKSNFSITSI